MSWEVRTQEHTFSTGRTATLRQQLPSTELMRRGLLNGPALEALQELVAGDLSDPAKAAELSDAIVVGMFVEPKVVVLENGDKPGKGEVPIAVLDEIEIAETIELAFGSVAGVAGFRRESRRPRARASRSGVGGDAGKSARSRARKPRGSAPKPKPRRPADD